jgi:hypothetical protein
MALRWCAAGMAEAGKQFSAGSTATCTCARCATRWNGSPNLSVPPAMMGWSRPPNDHRAAAEFHGLRDILCVSLGCYVEAYRTWFAVVMGSISATFGTGGEIAGAVAAGWQRALESCRRSADKPHVDEIDRSDLLLGGDPF